MLRRLLILSIVSASATGLAVAQATVRVEPAKLDGPRPLVQQTANAVIRDYLQSWQSLSASLEQNRPDLLDADFVGEAKDKLTATIHDQGALGLYTRYRDIAHDLQIVFYSPEGLSIEITDLVDYDVQLFDHGKPQPEQRVHARYIVVLTPAQVRWRVRVFQAEPVQTP